MGDDDDTDQRTVAAVVSSVGEPTWSYHSLVFGGSLVFGFINVLVVNLG